MTTVLQLVRPLRNVLIAALLATTSGCALSPYRAEAENAKSTLATHCAKESPGLNDAIEAADALAAPVKAPAA